MIKSTFLAAALAAGLTAIAAPSLAETPRTLVELLKASANSHADETADEDTEIAEAVHSPYDAIIAKYASHHGVAPSLAHAVIEVESNYRADARGRAGEIGLMQIKPATARMMGFSGSTSDLHDPDTNIRYGMKYLARAQELGGGDVCGTILRYNAGHGATRMNRISAAYCSRVKQMIGSL